MSAGSDASIYLCVSIDCECDKGPGWKTRKPLSFAAITAGIGERLQPLFRRYGAKPTYLLSPEVIRDPASVAVLASIAGQCELGTHLHGEFAEPGAFEPEVTSAFQCHYDRTTEQEKLRGLTALFADAFLTKPRSFRAGRFGIGPHSLGILADLGYTVDSSVTPFKDWAQAGAPEASFRRAPTQPYWPVLEKPAQIAAVPGPLLEIPVTIRPAALGWLPLVGRHFEPRWLRPTKGSVEQIVAVAEDEIATSSGRPIVLNCMFHNVEIMPGLSPYAQTEAEADAILGRLEGLLAFAARHGIATVGLGDVPSLIC
ncbi:MAG: hypothetical protein P4L57_10085 [Rhizomicrobium sp.]|nr:hypothetical protein [Rhizomicrobium sp.]